LDSYCHDIGRDPAAIRRSIALPVFYDDPVSTRTAVAEAEDAGFTHIVLMLTPPYPTGIAQQLVDLVSHP
jgi:hypothetical protein